MARKTTSLTNTEVDKAKPREKEYNLSDGEGLMLRVKPTGSKLWLFNYTRPFTKKRANISFGTYPELSLANARKKRTEARELLAEDIDPKEHRDEQTRNSVRANSNTLKHVFLLQLEVKKTEVSADHAHDILRSFELHLLPKLGSTPIGKLDAPTVIDVLKPIAAKSPETVKRLCHRMNEVMIYALNTGLADHNPLSGIKHAFEKPIKKHMPTISPEQLPTLMKTLTTASISLTTRCLIEWQLHTMVRPSEAAGARWDEIDTESALWVIPAERMKMKEQHIVPLTPQTMALLDVIRPSNNRSPYVFAGARNINKPTNSSTANVALKRMGYHKELVAHGLRSLASTILNNKGINGDLIEACLAHKGKDEVRNAYNKADYLELRREVMKEWSAHIEKAAEGNLSLGSK
ncbi:integrase domain-containing protein [Alkalimarinus sediminis]|uniref:Integrase domain-containing protein n=1 Tax=Alkalimarinus sediminis TaxID=1632866 RepID=A0A9E8KNC6_9ALTE|nr:integrase domain-containing protein [Alkalimarinus sediminis]UZW74228.1 integrase domain-containing protein [Alkalimarinus sediminis]